MIHTYLIIFCSMNTDNAYESLLPANITISDWGKDNIEIEIAKVCEKLKHISRKDLKSTLVSFGNILDKFSRSPAWILYTQRKATARLIGYKNPWDEEMPDMLVQTITNQLLLYAITIRNDSKDYYKDQGTFSNVLPLLDHILPYCWTGELYNKLVYEFLYSFMEQWYAKDVAQYLPFCWMWRRYLGKFIGEFANKKGSFRDYGTWEGHPWYNDDMFREDMIALLPHCPEEFLLNLHIENYIHGQMWNLHKVVEQKGHKPAFIQEIYERHEEWCLPKFIREVYERYDEQLSKECLPILPYYRWPIERLDKYIQHTLEPGNAHKFLHICPYLQSRGAPIKDYALTYLQRADLKAFQEVIPYCPPGFENSQEVQNVVKTNLKKSLDILKREFDNIQDMMIYAWEWYETLVSSLEYMRQFFEENNKE